MRQAAKMKKCALIVLLIFVLSACGGTVATPTVPPTATPKYKYTLLGTHGNTRYIFIDKGLGSDRTTLKGIADEVCRDQFLCVVYFWDDQSKAASGFPLTDAQVKAQIALYSYNQGTGLERLLICSVDGC